MKYNHYVKKMWGLAGPIFIIGSGRFGDDIQNLVKMMAA